MHIHTHTDINTEEDQLENSDLSMIETAEKNKKIRNQKTVIRTHLHTCIPILPNLLTLLTLVPLPPTTPTTALRRPRRRTSQQPPTAVQRGEGTGGHASRGR